jgi:DNA mismatch endonuclease (patch repair protein)
MSRIRSADTVPEIKVRAFLHRKGFRFRLNVKSLPGSPDIVLSKHRAAIFVHGCYWHRHHGCQFAYSPKSRIEFWETKFQQNVERDKRKEQLLVEAGWKVIIVWECETKTEDQISCALKPLLESQGRLE